MVTVYLNGIIQDVIVDCDSCCILCLPNYVDIGIYNAEKQYLELNGAQWPASKEQNNVTRCDAAPWRDVTWRLYTNTHASHLSATYLGHA